MPAELALLSSCWSSCVSTHSMPFFFMPDILRPVHGLVCKKPTVSIFKMNLMDNKFLLWTVALLAVSVFVSVFSFPFSST